MTNYDKFIAAVDLETQNLVADGYYIERKTYSAVTEQRTLRHARSQRVLTMYVFRTLLLMQLCDGKRILKTIQL